MKTSGFFTAARRVVAPALLTLGLAAGCGSDDADENTEQLGGGVGAKCTADSQCTGYGKPSCLTELKPLENAITNPDHPAVEDYRNMSMPFPGGYCTTTIENSCASDAECGEGGGCFLAFEGVSQQTIDALGGLDLPFDVAQFATLGICLKKCTATSECRTAEKYECIVPLTAFMDVINPDNKKTYCVQNTDYSHLLQ
jgi:hypothetical protein